MKFNVPSLISPLLLAASLVCAQELPAAGGQQEKHFEVQSPVAAKINYLLFLPRGYEKSKERWPLIIFLHGSGESGTDLAKVKKHGPPKYVETHPKFPFILVSP